ncbi:ferritin-like domain-containing protein [[Mycobacterium] nativiensis]|uniref:Ferritin-like domain-containing protein n=1 Tax=[Mycobacterium] nativiensis TaxID=2855503 RepID=A0ABU5XXM0_9MYCO|nr:ferritin-like domain-containing protein [Mycolicibacter sp. MYC340]MEB3032739.1 ferritin-like domain-containing protein [Mycolicibacter sp. MYC340]
MTSAEPVSGPDAALCDALATEYGVVYGYGLVSAYSLPEFNDLVVTTIRQHRERRDRTIAMLTGRSVEVPLAAAGYQVPIPVTTSNDALRLAVRMENDTATAWRAVVEQAQESSDREFAATALGQSAVLAAHWNQALGNWPITRAFPGGED